MRNDISAAEYKDYGFHGTDPSHMHVRFMPYVVAFADGVKTGKRALDVGCGSGFTCGSLLKRGWTVTGIDLSESGIAIARRTYPGARFEVMPADSHILKRLREPAFDLVVSTEVIEHLYSPRAYAQGVFEALKPGGRFICTTPYHGYLKNLVISVFNKWDGHANPLWDGGHIKLWSRRTLTRLLLESGLANIQFRGAGRLPWLWMTMVMSADKVDK